MSELTFPTRVCSIPCQIRVDSASRASPGSDTEPPEDSYFEWVLLDRKGYRAKWLERKLTSKQQSELDQQVCEALYDRQESLSYEPN